MSTQGEGRQRRGKGERERMGEQEAGQRDEKEHGYDR